MTTPPAAHGLSWIRIFGFASFQGFVYSLFYMGVNHEIALGAFHLERAELFAILICMLTVLAALRAFPRFAGTLTAAPRITAAVCALLMAASSYTTSIATAASPLVLFAASACVGVPSAVLLLSWAEQLGASSPRVAACEVFAAMGFAGAFCFGLMYLPSQAFTLVPKALPLVSAACLFALMHNASGEKARTSSHSAESGGFSAHSRRTASAVAPRETASAPTAPAPSAQQASDLGVHAPGPLTLRMYAGIAVFGLAAGFVETASSDPGLMTTPTFSGALIVLALFCIAVLQSIMPRNPDEREAFAGTYRIALLVILAGFLFSPVLSGSSIPGEAIILGGYLGLMAAFLALLLAMAHIAHAPAAAIVAQGFFAAYAGEAAGVVVANGFDNVAAFDNATPVLLAFAGLAALVAYLFLFTSRDFGALAAAVDEPDYTQAARERIAQTCNLSQRETEVLDLALRGRTNERIAQELFVAKSTADTHLRRIYAKCGVHTRQELIDLAERTMKDLMRP